MLWLFEGSQRQAWEHTSALICIFANGNRDPKERSRPFHPDDFNPYYAAKASAVDDRLIVPFTALKHLFVKQPEK